MHDMRSAILGSRAGQRQRSGVKVHLVPGQLRHFFPALACQYQKFQDASIRVSNLPSGPYDPSQLVIVEHAIARDLPGRSRQAIGRRCVHDRPRYAPAKECLHHLEKLIGGDRSAASRHLGHQIDNVTLADLVNAALAPNGDDLPSKHA